jgi:diaminopimelate epimerase
MRTFSKYHGTGNDFIFVQGPVENPVELAQKLCDRHFGLGADGLMYASSSDRADIRMHYFNSDGSEARMCGNGLRCFVRYLLDESIIKKESFIVETAAGLIPVEAHGDHIVLDLPVNRLKLDESELTRTLDASGSVNVEGLEVYPLFMGTQHAVVFANPDTDIKTLGPK